MRFASRWFLPFMCGLVFGCGGQAARSVTSGKPQPDTGMRQGPSLEGVGALSSAGSSLPTSEVLPYARRWYSNAVMYEVMVRSFQDSDGDGIGDLKGLIQRLDYLNTGDPSTTSDLKVDAIWLMPIFKSPSYHGYDATDYLQIDPLYGTMEDFHTLIREAHRRNIKVLLDLVLNHTSQMHPWFQRASRAKEGPDRAWYVWRQDDPGWVRPWGGGPVWHSRGDAHYYGLFWEGMPDLNFEHPPVRAQMIAIAKHWLEQGADGYRLDAIRYLFEEGKGKQADLPRTHDYLKELSRELHTLQPEVALIGEIWSETSDVAPYFGEGDELDLAFGFKEASGILEAVQKSNPTPLLDALRGVDQAYRERQFSAPFLTNHDMARLASILESDPKRLRLAASILLSLPGTPFLYQGEEIGLTNGSRPGDEAKRTPMQWTTAPSAGFSTAAPWNPLSGNQQTLSVEAQQAPDSLLSHYRRLIRQHKASDALRVGLIGGLTAGVGGDPAGLSFYRAAPGEVVVCVFNLGDKPSVGAMLPVDGRALTAAGLTVDAIVAGAIGSSASIPLSSEAGTLRISLPTVAPREAIWIRLARP